MTHNAELKHVIDKGKLSKQITMQRKQSVKSSTHGQIGELLPDISENPNDLHSSKIEVSSSSSSNSQS